MIRRELRRSAAACLGVCVLVGTFPTPGFAQTWRWNYVTRTPNAPPLKAQSTVTVSAGILRMRYTIPFNQRQIVIEACRAGVDDVAGASTIQTQGRTFLLVQLKPLHSASCASGSRPAVALPIDDIRYAGEIVAAVNRACCGIGARVAVRPAPSPRPSPVVAESRAGTPLPTSTPEPDASAAAPSGIAFAPADGSFIGPKLIKRGSSRLAIGITGTALVRLVIAQNGTPQEAVIVSISNRRLSAAAIETAVSSTFAPARHNGKPVSAKYVATFSFDGEDPALSSIPLWKRSPLPTAASATPTADASPLRGAAAADPLATPTMAPPPTPPAPSPPTPTPTPPAPIPPAPTPAAQASDVVPSPTPTPPSPTTPP